MSAGPLRSHADTSNYQPWPDIPRPERTGAAAGTGHHHAEGISVKKIRISKRRCPASGPLEPLPADPRDRDIMRAKQLARRPRPPGAAARARDAQPDQGFACAEDRHA